MGNDNDISVWHDKTRGLDRKKSKNWGHFPQLTMPDAAHCTENYKLD